MTTRSEESHSVPDPRPDAQATRLAEKGYDLFEVWKEYEKIAMHFNDLLMRLRSQSLGAVAALAALAGVILRGDIEPKVRWGAFAAAFLLLSLFWIAVWILDFMYYNRLLRGAVRALLEVEEESSTTNRVHQIVFSTWIENTVMKRKQPKQSTTREFWHGAMGRWLFYTVVLIALLVGFAVSTMQLGGIHAICESLYGLASP